MLKKTITYKDLDGNDVTEDFYFNLNKAEIAEMEMMEAGGLSTKLRRIVETNDQREIMIAFKSIIMQTIGRRSEDGRRFEKSERITNDFMQTDAYSVLFFELLTNPVSVVDFIKGVVPADIANNLPGDLGKNQPSAPEVTEGSATTKKIEEYTEEELRAMPYEEFEKLVSYDVGSLPKSVLVIALQRRSEGK
jgi:hypothetical protein